MPGARCAQALRYLGSRDGISSTLSQTSYFAAAAPRRRCWIFFLIKSSSKSLWSQHVARPWQPADLLKVQRGRRRLGEPDKPSSPRMKHSQKQRLKHPPTPATPFCHLPSRGQCPHMSSETNLNADSSYLVEMHGVLSEVMNVQSLDCTKEQFPSSFCPSPQGLSTPVESNRNGRGLSIYRPMFWAG